MLMTSSLCMHGRKHPAHQHAHSMIQVKGVADAGSAAVRVSGMELGGLFGSLLAGRLSDFLVRKFPNDGAVGKRVQVCLLLQLTAKGLGFRLLAQICSSVIAGSHQHHMYFAP